MNTDTSSLTPSAALTARQQLMLASEREPRHTALHADFSGKHIDLDRFVAAVATAMRCCGALALSVELCKDERPKMAQRGLKIENAIAQLNVGGTFSSSDGLFAVGIDNHGQGGVTLSLSVSNLIWDTPSLHNFMLCLDEAYADEPLYPEAYTFIDYACAEAEMRLTAAHAEQQRLWRDRFMPLVSSGIAGGTACATAEMHLDIAPEQVEHLCSTFGTSPDCVLAAAYAKSLTHLLHTPNAAFAVAHNPRTDTPAAAYTTGPMMQLLPVVTDCGTTPEEIGSQLDELTRNQAYGYADFVLDNEARFRFTIGYLAGMVCHPVSCGATCTETITGIGMNHGEDLGLFVHHNAHGGLTLRAEYRTTAFSPQQVDTLLHHYAHTLEAQLKP